MDEDTLPKFVIINLSKILENGKRVFSGKEFGKSLRKHLSLDELDENGSKICVLVPRDTISINSSFFLGMFGNSIEKYGEVNFRERYSFDCEEHIKINIEAGIARALLNTNKSKPDALELLTDFLRQKGRTKINNNIQRI